MSISAMSNGALIQSKSALSTFRYTNARCFSRKVVLIYCGIFYLIPFIIFLVLGNPLERVMIPRPSYLIGAAYIAVAVMLFYAATSLPYLRLRGPRFGVSALIFDSRVSLSLAMFFAVFCFWARNKMGLDFRHSGVSLADVGAAGFLLEFLKMAFGVMIIVNARMISEGYEVRSRRLALLFTACGYFFSIQGAFDIFFVVCALAAGGNNWKRLLGLHLKAGRQLSVLMIPVFAYLAVFIGTANKIGFEGSIALITNFSALVDVAIGRIGYHFYSTSIHATFNLLNFDLFFEAFSELYAVVQYRLSVLLGFYGVEKPEIGTISRMNFLNMAPVYRTRIGASPSLLGSVFYWPGAGFAIFYYVFIMRFVLQQIWKVVGPLGENWLFTIFCLILMASILDASLDSLNPFSIGAVRMVFLVLGARYTVWRLKSNRWETYDT